MISTWPGWPRPPLAEAPRDKLARGVEPRSVSFAGPLAGTIWAPRLPRLAEAALSAELALVSEGTLPATLIWATYVALGPLLRRLASMGLAAAPIRTAVGPLSTFSAEANANLDELLNYGLLVARDPIETATTRLATADPADAARWLNWPACCADAWANRLRDGLTDPVAAMLSRPVPDAPPPHAYALLAGLGLGPVRHAPCAPGCRASVAAAEAFIASIAVLGLADEAEWLRSMGGWTVEVSVNGGIAEVRTSVFRYAHLSDRLPARVEARSTGHVMPEGTPAGLASPFAAPPVRRSRPARPRSRPDITSDFPADFARAGYDSAVAMRSRFSTVLWEHATLLRRTGGSAIHLGCGDGLLLELLSQQRAGLALFGVETDLGLADLAQRRPCLSAANVLTCAWSDALASLAGVVASEPLVLFDLESFASHGSADRAEISRRLASLGATVIAIANDRALRRAGGIDALGAAAGLSLVPGRAARISGRVRYDPIPVGASVA